MLSLANGAGPSINLMVVLMVKKLAFLGPLRIFKQVTVTHSQSDMKLEFLTSAARNVLHAVPWR